MSEFTSFYHKESKVTALQLTLENQPAIIQALADDAADNKIETLSFAESDTAGLYNITFRYKTSTTVSKLEPGMYLVNYSTGRAVKTADAFSAEYSTSVPAGVILDQSVLSE